MKQEGICWPDGSRSSGSQSFYLSISVKWKGSQGHQLFVIWEESEIGI